MGPVLDKYTTKFMMKDLGEKSWVGFGICNKTIIEQNGYDKFGMAKKGHGFYGISKNGGVFNSTNLE